MPSDTSEQAENYDKSSSNSESSADLEPTRPNRWEGPPSSWLNLTKDERDLAASLDTIRDRNLSIHLYNAHALKRKAREIEEAETQGTKVGLPPQENTEGFVPHKSWTAWPLPPNEVPRADDAVGPEDGNERFDYRLSEAEWPSGELEDEMLATMLRIAKERWRAREEEEQNSVESDEDAEDSAMDTDSYGSNSKPNSLDYEIPPPGQQQIDEDDDDDSSSVTNNATRLGVKKTIEKEPKEMLRPVISTDDDRSRELLRPSIRHTLSKLDDILMALHHARETCRRYSRADGESENEARALSEALSDGEETTVRKRPRGRPRKFGNRDFNSGAVIEQKSVEFAPTEKKRRGRPRKEYDRLDGETDHEFAVRVARMQKKPLPAFAPPLQPSKPRSPSTTDRYRTPPGKRSAEDELEDTHVGRLGLRDWSEVLGIAAIVGFDPTVVERATKRCAALFGENMMMRTIVEAPYSEPADFTKTYQPETIPDLDNYAEPGSISDDSDDSETTDNIKREGSLPRRPSKPSRAPKIQIAFCPLQQCPRRLVGFGTETNLKRHLIDVHGIDETQLDDYIIPSDDEMDGAVHVDRFLRPMKAIKQRRKRASKPVGVRKQVNKTSGLDELVEHGDQEEDTDEDDDQEGDDSHEKETQKKILSNVKSDSESTSSPSSSASE